MSKRVHILGICGTFMGGVALLARELGYEVTGSDANVYPPMSTMLETAGIAVQEGYSSEHLKPAPDLVVIGNALSRGEVDGRSSSSKSCANCFLDKGSPAASNAPSIISTKS